MLNYNEAINIISEYFDKIELFTTSVNLADSLNYTLAEDIFSDINLPPFNTSSMDGYGIKINDGQREWKVIGEISAGNYTEFSIGYDEAISIMTGAKLPPDIDTIIPIEDVLISNDKISLIENSIINKGSYIRFCGEDLSKDKPAISKNIILKPKIISLAAACGKKNVKIYSPLKIGILSTGDELIDIDNVPQNSQIRATNLYTLISLIKEINMLPINYGFIKDDKLLIQNTLHNILTNDLDIFITTGGVSVGKYDYMKEIIEDLGCETIFWKVNVKPGKPLLFSIYKKDRKNILLFGLPGNPVSCFVCFHLYILPFINNLFFKENKAQFSAILQNDITKTDGRLHFVLANNSYKINDKQNYVKSLGIQSSGDMYSLSNSNCLIVFYEAKSMLRAGEIVQCIPI